jgi:N-acetylglucosaminyl-diphospho-decaprenol L-rhamnosyltransferase
MNTIDVSIIIVSWNVAALLVDCLRNIPNTPAVEIIVVDSASSDDSVARVRAEFPHVVLLPQTENVGFTRGNNIGLAAARGRYLFLLNPDTELLGAALTAMLSYMEQQPRVGIVGPHTLNTDRTTQSTKRRFPSVLMGFVESTWLQPLVPQMWFDHFYANDIADNATADVDWVQGSALLARREVYTQIGGLDTDFVMYSEELDWCKRAKDAGWRVVYFGGAQIIHHGGKSSEQVTARKHIWFQQSKIRYHRKHHGAPVAAALRAFLLLNYALQWALEAAKWLLRHKRPLRAERMKAYRQVLRDGLRVE